ncbi:MAG: DUF2199 domain-containing protein [Bacteroidota bacterium]
MSKEIQFKCSCCGKIHEEWPALTFNSPDNYSCLTEDDKKNIGYLDSDFCTINDNGEIHRFIRCTFNQTVNDHCEDLHYGLWVSLSEKSYLDYEKNFKKETAQEGYFGWLCNDIIDYEFSESIPMNVYTRTNGQRPELIPHENFNHPFVKDFYNGISKEEAEKRISHMLKIVNENETTEKKKWWKIWE